MMTAIIISIAAVFCIPFGLMVYFAELVRSDCHEKSGLEYVLVIAPLAWCTGWLVAGIGGWVAYARGTTGPLWSLLIPAVAFGAWLIASGIQDRNTARW